MYEDYRVMNGTFGEVWVDGELWYEVVKAQAKLTYNKEEIRVCGDMYTGSKITGVKGTGSVTLHKVYTRNAQRTDAITQGRDIRATMVLHLDDPDAVGAERVALYNVSFDEETIMDFESGKTTQITTPFTFGKREFLQKVNA